MEISTSNIYDLKITELVASHPAASVRLKNCILAAHKAGELPLNTIGEYMSCNENERRKFLMIKDLGATSFSILVKIIEDILSNAPLSHRKYPRKKELISFLNGNYPGLFQPLIDEYMSVSDADMSRITAIEKILRTLKEKSSHPEMVSRRAAGETLQSIGESFGVTRERVRQITDRYTPHVADIYSGDWAVKSIRHLAEKNNTGNILPANELIKSYHPKLADSLIRNFSDKKSGNLSHEQRFEIAKALNFDTKNEIVRVKEEKWTLQNTLSEVKQFAKYIGNPNFMPKNQDLKDHQREDLRGAIAKHGGQYKIAELAGLIYQGQKVGTDGTKTYWTDARIGNFLYKVAREEGHPGIMPTRDEVRKHVEKPNSVLTIFTRDRNDIKKIISWAELAKRHNLKYEGGK